MLGESESEIKNLIIKFNENKKVSNLEIKEINIAERLGYISKHNEEIRERILRRQKATVKQQLTLVKYKYFFNKNRTKPRLEGI